jgi:hypothetical protein
MTVALRAFHASVRRTALSNLSEERSLSEVARRSDDPEIALEALARVADVALLRRIAAGEGRSDVALAALARIDDPGLLQALAEDSKAHKGVRKQARARLDAVLTDDHPIRIAERHERQLQLCVTVEALCSDDADTTATVAALHQAQKNWRELYAHGTPDAELQERFRGACDTVSEALAQAKARNAQAQEREALRLQAYTARQQLCDSVEQLEGPETPARLEAARSAWEALSPSDDPRCLELASRFAQAVERCEQRHDRWRVRNAFRSQLEALVLEAERLVEAGDPRSAARPRATLEKRWARLQSSPEGRKWLTSETALQRRFVKAGEALKEQEQETRAQRQQREREGRAQLKTLCGRLEQLARAETFKHAAADRALAAAATALRQFPPLPASERNALRQRLTAAHETLTQRVQQDAIAEDWKRWANAEVQEKLIARAEALLAADDPAPILREIGQLESEWKRFAAAPRDRSQALWDRFRTARNAMRKRCNAYLAENLAKKEALCAAVEQLADSTDWNDTAAEIQRMQAEWKQIGPVRKQISAPLFERFRAPANRFFDRRKEFLRARKERREELLGRMRTLCEAAEAVADSTDWETTATEIKRLQGEARGLWKRPRAPAPPEGAAPRQPDALRERFQAACDRFFDRYRRRDELKLEGNVAAAEKILGDLDLLRQSIADANAPVPEDVSQRLKDRLAEWGRLGPFPTEGTTALRQRLQATCDAIEAACPDGLLETELAAQSNVEQREKLCIRLEKLATSLAADSDEPSPDDLAARLKLALAANTIGGSAATPREQALRDALETAERLRAKWERLGPVMGNRGRALAVRFDKAIADLDALRGSPGAPQKTPGS